MNLYHYFYDGSIWDIYAKDIEEARQLVFDMDRIPYDIMCIPTININMEVSNENEENKATEGKKDLAVNFKENASKTIIHATRSTKELVV